MLSGTEEPLTKPAWPVPEGEGERLSELLNMRIGNADEADLTQIAELASDLLDVPIALINLAYEDHMRVKARTGIGAETVPREVAFCGHTILTPEVLVVPDLEADARFSDNELVTGPANMRFYAGAPLTTSKGNNIGTICVLDTVARDELTAKQQRILKRLANLVVDKLELRRLQNVELMTSHFVASTAEAFLCVTADGLITHWNPAAEAMFGRPSSEALGRSVDIIVPDRFHGAHAAGFRRVANGATSKLAGRPVELTAMRANGEEFPIELLISVWKQDGNIGMGAVMRDLTLRKQHETRLKYLAHHDHLTGIPNRHRFCELLDAQIANGEPGSMLLIDIDGFRAVNDSLGHERGDTLLQAFAVRLAACLEPTMHLGRLGGDDFAVFLPGDRAAASDLAQAIIAATGEPFDLNEQHASLEVSIGVASVLDAGSSARLLLAAADFALAAAKADELNRYKTFEPHMRERFIERRELSLALRQATASGQFVLHYQPQVELRTGALTGVEALLRWSDPGRGLVFPGSFISVLESADCSEEVGWWTLEEACKQLAAWDRAGFHVPCVGVNLFARQFRATDFIGRVVAALAKNGLAPGRLELELTEKLALSQDDRSLSILREVRALGVRLAFDDFGTGFASLSTLKRIPLTRLKIDKSFVDELDRRQDNLAVVQAVLGIARDLRLNAIAEGIETEAQAVQLLGLGCTGGQGFLFGRGMPPDQLVRAFSSTSHEAA